MKRTQLITLLLVLFTGMGIASAKPKVAVLGLEVLDKSTPKASIDAARQVTEGLRAAGRAAGPFDVSDAQREFADEKVINGCESESRECLGKMTTALGTVAMVYGKLQLTDGKKNFQVTVWLLSLDKNSIKSTTATISAGSSAAELTALGKKMYGDLVGIAAAAAAPAQGTFTFKTKAKSGTVYIDGDARGKIDDGEYKSPPLADGEYKIRVEADGFKKWEDTVRIKGGQATSVDVKLEESAKAPVKPPTEDEDDKGNRGVIKGGEDEGDDFKLKSRENTISRSGGRKAWKLATVGGVAVTAGAMGVWGWQLYWRNKRTTDMEDTNKKFGDAGGVFGSNCKSDATNTDITIKLTMDRACDNVRNMWIAGTVAGAAGAFTLLAIYKGFIASNSEESNATATTKRARKPRFALTPIVSPDGAGASLRLDF